MGLYLIERAGINRTANEDYRHEPNRKSPPQLSPTGEAGSVACYNFGAWPYRDIRRDICRHLLGGGLIMELTISVSESRAARLKTAAQARRANAIDALLLAICFGAAAGIAGIVCLAIVRGIMAGA